MRTLTQLDILVDGSRLLTSMHRILDVWWLNGPTQRERETHTQSILNITLPAKWYTSSMVRRPPDVGILSWVCVPWILNNVWQQTTRRLTSDGSRPVFSLRGRPSVFVFLFHRAHQPNNVNGILLLLFFASLSCLPRHVQFQNRSTPEIDRFLMEIGTEPKSNMLNKWQRRKKKQKQKKG